ncbi:MAG: hypothetical protein IPI24_08830 [Ignavibacteria bacterium]|nr:hypothetical protein [Ignavibacteria bacterium]
MVQPHMVGGVLLGWAGSSDMYFTGEFNDTQLQTSSVQINTRVTPMELLIAIMCFFGLVSYEDAGISSADANLLLQDNQSTVKYYYDNPDSLYALPQRVNIDRAED